MKMKNRDIVIYRSDKSEYNKFAVNLLKGKFEELHEKEGKINVALSGGTTPLPILDILRKADLEWQRFNFFMVDERCVPLTDPASNYTNINHCFFSHIQAAHYSMIKEGLSIEESIKAYKEELISEVDLSDTRIPKFDLILLGMGEDGHTASLFPKSKALKEEIEIVTKNYVPQLDSDRITMTYPVLKNANEIIVLAKGSKKMAILDELYNTRAIQYPMYELIVSNVKMSWIVTE